MHLKPQLNPKKRKLDFNIDRKYSDSIVYSCSEIVVGTSCKHGGCNCSYESPASNKSECNYHPGVPIFHEGLKYWSCCTKRTSDFTAFMNQKGCAFGEHKWIEDVSNLNF